MIENFLHENMRVVQCETPIAYIYYVYVRANGGL